MQNHGKNNHRDLATGRHACSPSSSLPFPRSPEQLDNEQSLEESGDPEEILGPKSAWERDAALLASKIDRMREAIEGRSAAISTNKNVESTSIKELMKVVTARERDAALLASKMVRMFEAIEVRSAAISTNKSVESTNIKEEMKVVTARERDAALLASKIDRMCEAIEGRSAAISTNKSVESTSIKEVMKLVTSLPGAKEGTELWFFTTRLFLNREKREMFCTIEDPNLKLKWLKFEMNGK